MKIDTSKRVTLVFMMTCILILSFTSKSEAISLSELYSKEKLKNMLVPRAQWHPFPKAYEREAWTAISANIRQTFIQLGEESLKKEVPSLPATVYLEYKRIGNRSHYQNIWYERREMLHSLVLAECMEAKGRFLDAIAGG